jgi:hypothetical protein
MKDIFHKVVAHYDIKIMIVISIISVSSIIMCGGWEEGALPTWKTVNAVVDEDGEWKKTFTVQEHKFSIDFPADRSAKFINSE